uniref:Uncharacterized protein TCIL3000_10_14040 n=1 Tax=Trypanosoma congolense (strain IL3000) TaxID=1068625 RepID=G0UZ00_TRYCI|nr:unnamed protein product [Trypanosoma congolense IL3000]
MSDLCVCVWCLAPQRQCLGASVFLFIFYANFILKKKEKLYFNVPLFRIAALIVHRTHRFLPFRRGMWTERSHNVTHFVYSSRLSKCMLWLFNFFYFLFSSRNVFFFLHPAVMDFTPGPVCEVIPRVDGSQRCASFLSDVITRNAFTFFLYFFWFCLLFVVSLHSRRVAACRNAQAEVGCTGAGALTRAE